MTKETKYEGAVGYHRTSFLFKHDGITYEVIEDIDDDMRGSEYSYMRDGKSIDEIHMPIEVLDLYEELAEKGELFD